MVSAGCCWIVNCMQYYSLFKDGICGSRGHSLTVGVSITIHCLALRTDVPCLQDTSLAVVGMTCHNFVQLMAYIWFTLLLPRCNVPVYKGDFYQQTFGTAMGLFCFSHSSQPHHEDVAQRALSSYTSPPPSGRGMWTTRWQLCLKTKSSTSTNTQAPQSPPSSLSLKWSQQAFYYS